MLRKFKVYDIDWRVDPPAEQEEEDLPRSVDIGLEDEIEARLRDYLCDTYGFFTNGFCFEEVKDDVRK